MNEEKKNIQFATISTRLESALLWMKESLSSLIKCAMATSMYPSARSSLRLPLLISIKIFSVKSFCLHLKKLLFYLSMVHDNNVLFLSILSYLLFYFELRFLVHNNGVRMINNSEIKRFTWE